MSTLPQDWPLLDYAISWSAGPSQSPVQDYWCSLAARTEGTTSVKRGKQYELDQVQPGEMTLTLRNDDGAFDPTNTASPFWPQVKPYRLIRLRAQYPATVNLLTAAQAVGPFTGNQSLSGFSVTPGANYAAQCQGQGSGVTGTLALQWYSVTGALISTTTGTPVALPATGWTTVTVAGTAPANAVGAVLTFTQSGGTATTEQYQVEQNTTPSAYAVPGTWYSLFTGYVERWPQAWSSGGNYGTIKVDCVDLFAFLANAPLRDPFILDLLALGPNFLYPLNEANGSTTFSDASGTRSAARIVQTAVLGTLMPGQSIASADNAPQGPDSGVALTGGFLGSAGPVLSSVANGSGQSGISIPADPTGRVGPPASGGVTRLCAMRVTASLSNADNASPFNFVVEVVAGGTVTAIVQFGIIIQVLIDGTVHANVGPLGTSLNVAMPGIGPVINPTTNALIDGDWHLYGVSLSDDHKTLTAWCDMSATPNTAVTGTPINLAPTGGTVYASDVIAGNATNLIGDVGLVTELPFAMSGTLWQSLAESWRNAHAGERSDQRYQRILGWLGYTGPTRIDAGSSVDYGPATDIQGGSNPTYALQALQNVVATEFGQHYVAADGTIVFQARTDRYNPAPTVSFGEHAGEIPYTGAKMDNDPTRVANQIEVDAQYGNAPYFASDTASQNDYGQIGLQWTANSLDPNELQDGAEYLLYQNKQPLQRLEALPVDVGANPGLWASLLPLELGQAVTVNRRPSNAPVMSMVGFVEQITWSIDDQRKVAWSAQVSNAAAHYFGKLDDSTYGKLDSTLILGF